MLERNSPPKHYGMQPPRSVLLTRRPETLQSATQGAPLVCPPHREAKENKYDAHRIRALSVAFLLILLIQLLLD